MQRAAQRAGPADAASIERVHEAARSGSAEAQNELGCRYETGDGVPKDRQAALLFLKLAADQGLAVAQNHLAEILCATDPPPRRFPPALARR